MIIILNQERIKDVVSSEVFNLIHSDDVPDEYTNAQHKMLKQFAKILEYHSKNNSMEAFKDVVKLESMINKKFNIVMSAVFKKAFQEGVKASINYINKEEDTQDLPPRRNN